LNFIQAYACTNAVLLIVLPIRIGKQMPELAVAHNHLEACQIWQGIINDQPTVKAKDEAGHEALKALKGQTYLGTRKLILGGEAAMFFPDGIDTLDEAIWPIMQFGAITAHGWLGRLSYKRIKQEAFIDWALYHPCVLGPAEDEYITPQDQSAVSDEPLYRLPIDQTLSRPLHFPVDMINYALCYDK
jgi:hypothetical protein